LNYRILYNYTAYFFSHPCRLRPLARSATHPRPRLRQLRALNTALIELLQNHKPTRSKRSSASHFRFHGTTFHLVLVLFISLLLKYGIPYRLTFCILKHCSFGRHLKTHYFQSVYPAPCRQSQCALILYWDFGGAIYTYLLTYLCLRYVVMLLVGEPSKV